MLLMMVLSAAIVIVVTKKEHAKTPATYQQCADKGYPIQESYPQVCRIPGGRSFSNPTQMHPPQPQ